MTLAEQIAQIIREAMWNSKDPKATADQIIAIVREEAAKVVDHWAETTWPTENEGEAHDIASAIRQLGSAS